MEVDADSIAIISLQADTQLCISKDKGDKATRQQGMKADKLRGAELLGTSSRAAIVGT